MDFRRILRHLLGYYSERAGTVEDVSLASHSVSTCGFSSCPLGNCPQHYPGSILQRDILSPATNHGCPLYWMGPMGDIAQILAGVAPAFAVFGFYRLWQAAVEFSPTTFYQSAKDQSDLIKGIEPTID